MIYFLKADDIKEINKEIIKVSYEKKLSRTWKSDCYELKAPFELFKICKNLEESNLDIYQKAAELLIEITKKHCFISANRRTAYYSAVFFLTYNGYEVEIKDVGEQSKILKRIREGNLYSINEIANWLRNGKIRKEKTAKRIIRTIILLKI